MLNQVLMGFFIQGLHYFFMGLALNLGMLFILGILTYLKLVTPYDQMLQRSPLRSYRFFASITGVLGVVSGNASDFRAFLEHNTGALAIPLIVMLAILVGVSWAVGCEGGAFIARWAVRQTQNPSAKK